MTPRQFRKIRTRLGLSQSEMARKLRLGKQGARTVRRWELNETPVPGPVSVAMEGMFAEWEGVSHE